jgi:hypothetical protein
MMGKELTTRNIQLQQDNGWGWRQATHYQYDQGEIKGEKCPCHYSCNNRKWSTDERLKRLEAAVFGGQED